MKIGDGRRQSTEARPADKRKRNRQACCTSTVALAVSAVFGKKFCNALKTKALFIFNYF
jgi:hypothetical protein